MDNWLIVVILFSMCVLTTSFLLWFISTIANLMV